MTNDLSNRLGAYTPWKDFNYKNMHEQLERYLKIEGNFDAPKVDPALLILTEKRHLNQLISCWHCPMVNQAMEVISKEHAKSPSSGQSDLTRLLMRPGWIIPSSGMHQLNPDWSGLVDGATSMKSLMPGYTLFTDILFSATDKRVQAGDGREKEGKPTAEKKKSDYKLACLGKLCACAYYLNTRYAYILTPHQAIFVRISRGSVWTPGTSSIPDLDVPEVSVVPWHGRDDGMTMVHALVWIHYLAGIECDIRDEYEPLGSNI